MLLSNLLFPAVFLGLGVVSFAQSIDPASFQKIIEENLDLRRDQDRLGREIGDLRRQNASLILDVRDLERKRDQLTALVAQLKTPEETKAEVARLQAENLVLIRELDRLRQALGTMRAIPTNSPAPVQPAPAPGSDLFRKLEQENAGLRQELVIVRGTVQVETASRDALKQRVADLEAEARKLAGEVETSKQVAARTQKVADAFRKALDKLARLAYQQEQEIRDLKDKAVKESTSTVTAAGKGTPAGAASAKPEKRVVRDRTVISLFSAAEKALQEGKTGDAEKFYLEALRRDRSNPRVHYNLGVLYDDYLKQPRKAVQYYRKYLELNPAAPDEAVVRAWIENLESE